MVKRRLFVLPALVTDFLLQYAYMAGVRRGRSFAVWRPVLPRKHLERGALKALRGDFTDLPTWVMG